MPVAIRPPRPLIPGMRARSLFSPEGNEDKTVFFHSMEHGEKIKNEHAIRLSYSGKENALVLHITL